MDNSNFILMKLRYNFIQSCKECIRLRYCVTFKNPMKIIGSDKKRHVAFNRKVPPNKHAQYCNRSLQIGTWKIGTVGSKMYDNTCRTVPFIIETGKYRLPCIIYCTI